MALLKQMIFILLLSLVTSVVRAQSPNQGSGGGGQFEMGFHIGNILPNQIPGMTEIISLGGVRMGYGIGAHGAIELGAMAGRGEGAEYTDIHLSLRMDMQVETLVGIIFLGPDYVTYKGAGLSTVSSGGGHFGGGVMSELGDGFSVRSEMKFNVNPGTSLYINLGFVAEI